MESRNFMTLNELPVGKAAVITKVGGAGALRCRLLDMGLITEQEYQKMAVKITNSPDRLRQESRP